MRGTLRVPARSRCIPLADRSIPERRRSRPYRWSRSRRIPRWARYGLMRGARDRHRRGGRGAALDDMAPYQYLDYGSVVEAPLRRMAISSMSLHGRDRGPYHDAYLLSSEPSDESTPFTSGDPPLRAGAITGLSDAPTSRPVTCRYQGATHRGEYRRRRERDRQTATYRNRLRVQAGTETRNRVGRGTGHYPDPRPDQKLKSWGVSGCDRLRVQPETHPGSYTLAGPSLAEPSDGYGGEAA